MDRPQPIKRRVRIGSKYDEHIVNLDRGWICIFHDKATANRVKRYAESLGRECVLSRDSIGYKLQLKDEQN
jgi:hypothetical protein